MSQIDARGPRFGAAITTVVLAAAIIAGPGVAGTTLLVVQAFAFALGAVVGVHAQPYGLIFKHLVKPRLVGPTPLEDAAPPRFAQAVGLVFAGTALLGAFTGAGTVFTVAAAFALAAAFLNAAFAFCLGCEMYLVGKRLLARS